jgi:hypothetical protein
MPRTPNVEVATDVRGDVVVLLASSEFGVRAVRFDAATRTWTPEELLQGPISGSSPGFNRLGLDDYGNAVAIWTNGGRAWMSRFACEG